MATNLTCELKDGKVVLTFDPSKDFGPSSTGKSLKVASTDGNLDVPGVPGLKVGLNAFRPVGSGGAKGW
jgi:hypothetical protein